MPVKTGVDPNEAQNLAADPSAATALADMRARLDRWMQATDDPLLRGPIPAPAGAVVADPDDTSELTAERIRVLRSRQGR